MSANETEQERLRRLRERQIADRDPTTRKQEFQRQSIARERKAYKTLTLGGAWAEIPHVWKGSIYALVLGLIVVFAITSVWTSPLAWIIAGVSFVFILIVGVVIGNTMDLRDRIRDNAN
jgi:TRAP-type C4-dicarboxylate transport system permease large subunit